MLFCAQIPDIQAQKPRYFLADSLFEQQLWQPAINEYERQLKSHPESHPMVHVKLAFASEKLGMWSDAVYHLQQYYAFKPTDGVYDKVLSLAEAHQMPGYGRDDLNFLYTLYLEYYTYVMLALLLFAIYLVWIFWAKKKQGQKIAFAYQSLFYGYLILLILLTNTFSWLQFGIVKSPDALLRTDPSAGAETRGTITQGHKINIIGSQDIWYRIYVDDQFAYIKKSDLWLIK